MGIGVNVIVRLVLFLVMRKVLLLRLFWKLVELIVKRLVEKLLILFEVVKV